MIAGIDPGAWAAFMAAALVLNLTPGSDVLFTIACGARGGWRAGVAAAGGVALGILGHVALAVVGLATVLAAHPGALDVIRWAGAAYLVWLAVQAWRAAPADPRRAPEGIARVFWRGALTNALNPKVGLFVAALLPQFADASAGPLAPQLAVLGAALAASGFVVTAIYGAAARAAAGLLHRYGRVLNRVSAVVFAGLALRLVWD
ncbi:LysE family translocator [Citreimonas sp.]|uniref:LysE family translocator n=1 Tax=Citreimonas sp. TaxID=3036715 RepID=UPI004057D09A